MFYKKLPQSTIITPPKLLIVNFLWNEENEYGNICRGLACEFNATQYNAATNFNNCNENRGIIGQ